MTYSSVATSSRGSASTDAEVYRRYSYLALAIRKNSQSSITVELRDKNALYRFGGSQLPSVLAILSVLTEVEPCTGRHRRLKDNFG